MTTPADPRIALWHYLGMQNPWIREAYDPPFTHESFVKVAESPYVYIERDTKPFERAPSLVADALWDKMGGGATWCLGQAFYVDLRPPGKDGAARVKALREIDRPALVFIQQIDGGDEWLVIKHYSEADGGPIAFESISPGRMDKGYFRHIIEGMARASRYACKHLRYATDPDAQMTSEEEACESRRTLAIAALGIEEAHPDYSIIDDLLG